MKELIELEGFKKYYIEETISDLGQYVRNYLEKFPDEKIFIGCDSIVFKRTVNYASVIAFYDEFRKCGVHYIFKKEHIKREKPKFTSTGDKGKDRELAKKQLSSIIFNRIWVEVEKLELMAQYFEKELEGYYKRYTPEELVSMGYSAHQDKLIDIHVDINPNPGYNSRQLDLISNGIDPGMPKNKSYLAYESAKAYLEGLGYRVTFKPKSWAANTAADAICK